MNKKDRLYIVDKGGQEVRGNGEFDHWEWEGSVRGLVNAVGSGDARLGFVVDKKSGAKISMNISGTDDLLATEPFFVESPDEDNLYDASNRREAVKLLSNARKGMKYLDENLFVLPKRKKAKRVHPGFERHSLPTEPIQGRILGMRKPGGFPPPRRY